MHNSSRRDKGQLKAKKLKTVFIQHTVNKITLHFILFSFTDFVFNPLRHAHPLKTGKSVGDVLGQIILSVTK